MKVLVACEMSGRVRDAFRLMGYDAWSVDTMPACRIPEDLRRAQIFPEHHFIGDAREYIERSWDMLIAFPECTYLSNSGAKHLYNDCSKENGIEPVRWANMTQGARFFRELWDAPIKYKCIENPVMHGHAKAIIGVDRKRQFIQPWQFGHKEMKATGLLLDNLPRLVPTDIVGPPPTDKDERKKWEKVFRMPPGPERKMRRSLTYPGVAVAMAQQWGKYVTNQLGTDEKITTL